MTEQWEEISVPTHPTPNGKWVSIIEEIRLNATGEVRFHESHTILDDGEEFPRDYIWRDGNYSCDCNRSLFFNRAAGVEPEDSDDCGHEKYSVNVKNKVTGTCFYKEFGDD